MLPAETRKPNLGLPKMVTDAGSFQSGCDMIPTEKYGIYHVRNEGYISWADFAKMIMEKSGLSCRIVPVPSSEYASLARRPLNSRLSGKKLQIAGFGPMPSVSDALDRYLAELKEEETT